MILKSNSFSGTKLFSSFQIFCYFGNGRKPFCYADSSIFSTDDVRSYNFSCAWSKHWGNRI